MTLAADVDAVRTALGYERIIYYGASYGAQLGQHIMRDFPDMLEAVILDGANSLSRLHWTEDRALSRQWGIDNLTALCQADAQCAAAYDIPALLDAALDLFADGPLPATYVDPDDDTISYAVELSQKDLVDFIAQEQESRIAALAIPYILSQFSQGDQEDALALLAEEKVSKILASREATQGAEALLMHLAVVCSDDAVTSPDQVETAGVSRFAESFGKDEASWYATACGLIDVTELPPSTDVDVTLAVPTLLLSGGLDVATPTFRTQVVADALPDAQLVIFPSRTHVQIAGANFCAGQITTQFVLDPTGPLDTSCIEDDRVLGFVLPDGSMSGEQE